MQFVVPTTLDIDQIAKSYSNTGPFTIARFPTGLCHYVFDVKSKSENFVVRVCHPDNRDFLKGHLFWTNELKEKKLPLAKTLFSSLGKEKYEYVILERINGVDLGDVYNELSQRQKMDLVDKLVEYQNVAEELPLAIGYGWGFSYDCNQLKKTWGDVIKASLERARSWISSVGRVDLAFVDRVENLLPEFETYFKTIKPRAFFHDLTTKNLLLSKKGLSIVGFVDVDEMGFGDKLFHLSLMNMALLSSEKNNDLIDYWLNALEANITERRVVNLYTLIHCAVFMGENGRFFNKDSIFNEKYHLKLTAIFEFIFKRLIGSKYLE